MPLRSAFSGNGLLTALENSVLQVYCLVATPASERGRHSVPDRARARAAERCKLIPFLLRNPLSLSLSFRLHR